MPGIWLELCTWADRDAMRRVKCERCGRETILAKYMGAQIISLDAEALVYTVLWKEPDDVPHVGRDNIAFVAHEAVCLTDGGGNKA